MREFDALRRRQLSVIDLHNRAFAEFAAIYIRGHSKAKVQPGDFMLIPSRKPAAAKRAPLSKAQQKTISIAEQVLAAQRS